MEVFLQQLISGITVGSTYALVALGFSMQYRAMNLLNFAHGESFMLGAFVALTLIVMGGLPFPLAFLLTLAILGLLGVVIEFLAIRPLYRAPAMNMFISTIGLSLLLRQSANLIFGAEAVRFPTTFGGSAILIGPIILIPQYLWTVVSAIVLMLIFQFFLTRTRTGKAMRATAQDPTTAALMGIDTARMNAVVFALSTALGAAAGILFAPLAFVVFDIGLVMGIKGFTAAVLGGIGSLPGAILGGIILGVVEQFSAGYVSSLYKDTISLSLLILFLLVRPAGLLGRGGWGKV